MIGQSKLGQLRARHYGLEKLPETVRIPALGNRREETVKPIEAATVDDLAFALIALNERSSVLYREIDALRTLQDEARKVGARHLQHVHAIPKARWGECAEGHALPFAFGRIRLDFGLASGVRKGSSRGPMG